MTKQEELIKLRALLAEKEKIIADLKKLIQKQQIQIDNMIQALLHALTYEDSLLVREEVAPLILPDSDEASAVRFDALIYGMELAYLVGKKYSKARSDLMKRVSAISSVANIPEIQVQSELIHQILHTDYIEQAGMERI